MIEFKNVTKRYSMTNMRRKTLRDIFSFKNHEHLISKEVFYALKDVSFNISKGDCVGILGRNGSGKSTILKLISRVTLPTSGSIVLNGKVSSLLEVGSGFHPDLSGIDNVFLSGAILGMSSVETNQKLEQIIAFAEIGDFIYEPVKFYSMGMYLRLAFAIGISLDSEILIIDEALAVGDAVFQQKCIARLTEIIENGRTVVFVSHDINQIKSICSKAMVMEHGEIKMYGDVLTGISLYEEQLSRS